ncbi:MAG: FecR domain-containing protein, partial [Deltaproteobacteria bacterium]|nr:FecR domain-containing protein [Deltaproteobacteria bacterium]
GVINLFRGKIRAVVSKSRGFISAAFGAGARFEVRTPTAVAGVKGTDFFVFYSMGVTSILVTDGKVDTFNPLFPNQVVRVSAGSATFITGDEPPSPPRPALDVEVIRYIQDTDTGEEPKVQDSGGAAGAGGDVFGFSAPDEGTPPLPDTGDIAGTIFLPITETHQLLLDTIPPEVSIVSKSAIPSAAATADITINFGSNETAAYSYQLDAGAWNNLIGSSLTLPGVAEGAHTINYKATDTAGNTSTPASLSFYLSRYSLTGKFYVTIGGAVSSATGEVAGISNQGWGGWNINTGGAAPSTIYAGGTSADTLASNNGGYWLLIAPGTTTFKYLSYDRYGTGAGLVSGAYTETPLAWSGRIDYDYNDNGLYYSNVDGIWGAGNTYSGLVGGTASPWSGTTSLTLMGPYYWSSSAPYLWNAPIYSYDWTKSTYTTYDGGAFWGLTGGVWKSDGTIDAKVYSLYIDPSGNAGILIGSLTGGYYSALSMFEADGTWTPTALATGLSPASLGSLTYSPDYYFYGLTSASGGFTAGGSIYENYAQGLKYSIPGQDWGILQNLAAGYYSDPSSDTWNLSLAYVGPNSYNCFGYDGCVSSTIIVGTQTDGAQWSNGVLKGQTYGYGADISGTNPMTWISVGETIGTFNATALTWQAVQTGAWLDTNKFLAMTQTAQGQAALTALNIPFAEVGRANLTDQGTGLIGGTPATANMNNV